MKDDTVPLTALIHALTARGTCETIRCVGHGELTPAERETGYQALYSVSAACLLSLVACEAVSHRLPSPRGNESGTAS